MAWNQSNANCSKDSGDADYHHKHLVSSGTGTTLRTSDQHSVCWKKSCAAATNLLVVSSEPVCEKLRHTSIYMKQRCDQLGSSLAALQSRNTLTVLLARLQALTCQPEPQLELLL